MRRKIRKPKLVLHHDDPPCTARLNADGLCEKCKVHPDTQSTSLYPYCPDCDVILKGFRCPRCKESFNPQQETTHFVSTSYNGEKCRICKSPATHKIGEEIPSDDPNPNRHGLTTYVCCKHFRLLMGLDVPN